RRPAQAGAQNPAYRPAHPPCVSLTCVGTKYKTATRHIRDTATQVEHPAWLSVVSREQFIKLVEQLAEDVAGDHCLAVRLWDTRLPGADPAVADYHVWMLSAEPSEP